MSLLRSPLLAAPSLSAALRRSASAGSASRAGSAASASSSSSSSSFVAGQRRAMSGGHEHHDSTFEPPFHRLPMPSKPVRARAPTCRARARIVGRN